MGLQGALRKAYIVVAVVVGVYAVILGLLCVPEIQRQFVFLHWVNLPFPWHLHHPERFGLAPHKTRNFDLTTSDDVKIGAWHVLPRSIYSSESFPPTPSPDRFEKALRQRPICLSFHGNAGNRAAPFRVRQTSAMSNILDCNVIAIDYRGFGDSDGSPTEQGLLRDGRAAWDYASKYSKDVIVIGHSLGTGVAALLVGQLADEGVHPRAVALIAPFSSALELLLEYWLFDFIPVLQPSKFLPPVQKYFQAKFVHHFNSTEAISKTKAPILIAHSKDDNVIPFAHSHRLFQALQGDDTKEETIDGWGTLYFSNSSGRQVIMWEGLSGGHNNLGDAEGTMDLIRRVARL